MKKWLSICLSMLLIFTLTACNNDEDKKDKPTKNDFPVTIGGVTVEKQPKTVVSLSPSLTEITFDLNYGDRLVGVSSYCDFPSGASSKADCGTAQAPDLAKIKELAPQYLLTTTPLVESDLIQIQQMDIQVIRLDYADDLEKVYTLFGQVAQFYGGSESGVIRADETLAPYKDKLTKMKNDISSYLNDSDQLVGAYLRILDFTLATGDTLLGEVLEMIGVINPAAEYGEWTYPADKAAELMPNVLFYDKGIDKAVLIARPAYKSVPAVTEENYYPIDTVIFERQGLRMFDTILEMASLAYPDAVTIEEPQPDTSGDESSEAEE